ncbi:putative disease resistance protein At1g63350 [Prosopis cineraria]|uniref:putative disease resistance protein At1g63350 n=1 Tax=Prosopis cineraria TaxID=364024 RepID=UPI0024104E4B|nr:putative disease resistance protein At1g63350 [Prosopis cineraria]
MAEVGVSVASKLAEYLVHPTSQQLQYLFCVGKITKNVEIRKEELILKQGRVQELVQEAINRTERIDDEVNKWKNDMKSLITELENLEEEVKANNSFLRRWCPTWRRYCLYKKLAKTTRRMIELNTKSDHFDSFSHPITIPDIEYHSSQNFKFFNSTQRAFDQLWEALKDDGNSIIGLWGMGGSGKTTLVTEVGKKAKESKLFDRVVKTTISQNLDIRKVQGEIVDMLGLKLEEESEIGRARRIALRLQNEERILIILDDVWAKLNLEDIGIPFGGNHQRRCKIVLTTRCLDVCTLMDCQKHIHLHLLNENEAWTLFQTHANANDATKEVVAREIVKECKGLAIAIVALGTCLKGKGVDEMKVVLYKLRNAKPNNVDKGVRDAFACLELSYAYLGTTEAKLLLLMCAMFPEDHKIVIEDLFRYGVGLGLCRDVDSFEIARSHVRAAINNLIESSLLMHLSKINVIKKDYVTMHDMVRDVVLWIASKEDHTIMVNCKKELNELVDDEGVKDCYAIASRYNINELPQFASRLDAPKLKILLLDSTKAFNLPCQRIKGSNLLDASFEGIKGLKVLAIINKYGFISLMEKPRSMQKLSNLQTLRLQNWDLGDISFVVSLRRLEILDLRGSKFEKVPNGIEKLNKLKLLDLSRCTIYECCYEAIEKCSQLEELYVYPHFHHPRNTNCYEYLLRTSAMKKLRRYELQIGDCGEDIEFWNEGTRSLCLVQLNISMAGAIIKDLTQRATAIQFYELQGGCKSFIPNMIQAMRGMNELTKLYLQHCSEIECFMDETIVHEDVIVPRLNELELIDMDNLKQICPGPSPLSLFQKLERLSISDCPQLLHMFPDDCSLGNLKFLEISGCPLLTSLFPVSIVCTLLKLQRLFISDAPHMKFVFGENSEEQPDHDRIETQIMLPLLEYINLENLPNLAGMALKSIIQGAHL